MALVQSVLSDLQSCQQAALSFRVAAADAPAKQRLDAFLAGKMPQASRARLQVSCCQSGRRFKTAAELQ